MFSVRKLLKRCGLIVALFVAFQIFVYFQSLKNKINLKSDIFNLVSYTSEKISWEDIDFIRYEKNRRGPGENDEIFTLTDPDEIAKNEELFKKEGFYVLVSDKISPDRAIPDRRPAPCSAKKYLKNLPKVSVIITFHNEIWSVLLRCVHSIYNRSPKELLHEIVLINDASTFTELYQPLQEYFNGTFDSKVVIHVNENRLGLIKARVVGARVATGEVIIFLDSHMEVTTSWLPPLLEPLVYHPTYAAVPIVDGANHATLKHSWGSGLFRGTFDWSFKFNWLPIRKKDKPPLGENYEVSCMTGGAYAIRREHFFYLGGYDEEMQIHNGENYDISLKLWLCSGGIVNVPCSRIVHLSKLWSAYRTVPDGSDYSGRNLKRVVEVWLDDYKKYFYRIQPERFAKINAGDLTKQLEIKKKLQCKPFQYYLDVVAPEILERFPINPKYFAKGGIQNIGLKKCLSLQKVRLNLPIVLVNCSDDLMNPPFGANFMLSYEKSVQYNNTYEHCLAGPKLEVEPCHHAGGNQRFTFNITTRQFYFSYINKCLAGVGENDEIKLVDCDENSDLQKWKWGYEDMTALNNYEKTGIDWSEYY